MNSLSEWDCPALWDEEWGGRLYPAGFRTVGRCRQCGCTPRRACTLHTPLETPSCVWLNDRMTLCSACSFRPWRRRYRRPRLGHTRALQIRAWYAECLAKADAVMRAYVAARGAHRRFEIDVDGKLMSILGDPDMGPETLNALAELGRAIDRQFGAGLGDDPA